MMTNTITTLVTVGRKFSNAQTRSSAVSVIADRTEYDVRYGYRSLSGIAVVSVSIYLLFQFQISMRWEPAF